jgi:hypothetical protein
LAILVALVLEGITVTTGPVLLRHAHRVVDLGKHGRR